MVFWVWAGIAAGWFSGFSGFAMVLRLVDFGGVCGCCG